MDHFVAGWIFWVAAVGFGVVLAIAWIVLPFAMFGVKPLLRELIAEVKRTNALLDRRELVSRGDTHSER